MDHGEGEGMSDCRTPCNCGHDFEDHGPDGADRCHVVTNPQRMIADGPDYRLCPCGNYVEDEA